MQRVRTPLFLLLLFASASLLPGAAVAAEADAESGPRAVFDNLIGDLGSVDRGQTRTHVFKVTNEGDETLKITSVRPACGCAVAEFDRSIEPGETGEIRVDMDTSTLTGGVGKHVMVLTNDPTNPSFALTVNVRVIEHLVLNPGFARYVQSRGAGKANVPQILMTGDFDDLEVTRVESPGPYIEVRYREAEEDELRPEAVGRQWILDVELDYDSAPVGALSADVVVYTNHPLQESTTLPVSGFVRPMMAVTPPVADFQQVDPTKKYNARLFVNNFAPFDVHVTKVETTVPGIEARLVPQTEGKRYYVELIVDPDMPKGDFAGEVRIHTDNDSRPMLTVDLKGEVI